MYRRVESERSTLALDFSAAPSGVKRRDPELKRGRTKERPPVPRASYSLKLELELVSKVDLLLTHVERLNDMLERLLNDIGPLTARQKAFERSFSKPSKQATTCVGSDERGVGTAQVPPVLQTPP